MHSAWDYQLPVQEHEVKREGESHKVSLKNPHLSANLELQAGEDQEEPPMKSSMAFWRKMKQWQHGIRGLCVSPGNQLT